MKKFRKRIKKKYNGLPRFVKIVFWSTVGLFSLLLLPFTLFPLGLVFYLGMFVLFVFLAIKVVQLIIRFFIR